MAWRRRSYPKRRKVTPGDPYRSGFEKRLSDVLVNCRYEKRKLEYITESVYTPDYDFPDKDWMVIECKGYFIDGSSEARKYIDVSKQYKDIEIVFIFERATAKAYASLKVRKDGSFMTLGEWAAKSGFVFFDEKDIPQWFIDGDFDRDKLIELKRELKQEWLGK